MSVVRDQHAGSPDQALVLAFIVAIVLGCIMVYSATIVSHGQTLLRTTEQLLRQLIFAISGGLLAWLSSRLPLPWLQRLAKVAVLVAVLLLVLVFTPLGIMRNGAQRWIALPGIMFQPSELSKLLLVLYAADFLARKQDVIGHFQEGVFGLLLVLMLTMLLLLQEPDFGTAVVLGAAVLGMLFMAGMYWRHMIPLFAAVSAAGIYLVFSQAYRMDRVIAFLDPWSDRYGKGLQLVHSLIAFGRGHWFGVGLGESVQKLRYLPHPDSDFLLAVIGEELGFVGVIGVMVIFVVIGWRAFALALRAEQQGFVFAARLAQGLGLLLVLQAMMNIAVNLGAMPTKGINLPLMSAGGSSLMSSSIEVGLLLAVSRLVGRTTTRKRKR